AIDRGLERAVNYYPDRASASCHPYGKLRVISEQRARTGHDSIDRPAQTMDELPRAFRGYPAGIARERSCFPVHGQGALHGHIGKTGCHMLDEREVQGPAPGLTQTGLHLYTRFPETFDTPAAHQRIRIDHPDKDPGDSCRGNGLGTGRGLAEMGAGLQRYIQISTSGTP